MASGICWGQEEKFQGTSLCPTGTAERDVPPVHHPESERRQGLPQLRGQDRVGSDRGTGGTAGTEGVLRRTVQARVPPSPVPQIPPSAGGIQSSVSPGSRRQQRCRAAPHAPARAPLLPSPRSSSALAGDADTVPPALKSQLLQGQPVGFRVTGNSPHPRQGMLFIPREGRQLLPHSAPSPE